MLRGGTDNSEIHAVVLSEILKDGNFRPLTLAFGRIRLAHLLIKEAEEALSDTTRDVVTSNLIEVVKSQNFASNEIFKLFFEVEDNGKMAIDSVLTAQNHKEFLSSYIKFRQSDNSRYNGQRKFEKQLGLK